MKSYKSAQPLPNFPSPLYYLMSSAPITTFIYGVYYVFICLFYIIFHQHVSSKEKENLVLFCVFLVSRIATAYRGLRLKAAKHDEKYTIHDLCKIDFDFSVAQFGIWLKTGLVLFIYSTNLHVHLTYARLCASKRAPSYVLDPRRELLIVLHFCRRRRRSSLTFLLTKS